MTFRAIQSTRYFDSSLVHHEEAPCQNREKVIGQIWRNLAKCLKTATGGGGGGHFGGAWGPSVDSRGTYIVWQVDLMP